LPNDGAHIDVALAVFRLRRLGNALVELSSDVDLVATEVDLVLDAQRHELAPPQPASAAVSTMRATFGGR
jgi:hypothetical protein